MGSSRMIRGLRSAQEVHMTLEGCMWRLEEVFLNGSDGMARGSLSDRNELGVGAALKMMGCFREYIVSRVSRFFLFRFCLRF